MSNLWESIKAHPYLTGGLVLLLFVLIVLLMTGGSNETVSPGTYDNSAEVNAATALQARQLELQAATNQTTIAAGVREKEIAATLSIATLQMQTQQSNADLLAEIARERNTQDYNLAQMQMTTAADLTKFTSTLQATVAGNQIDSQRIVSLATLQHVTDIATINASQSVALANIQASAYTKSQAINATLAAFQTHAALVGQAALASILSPYPETRGGAVGNLGLNPPVFAESGAAEPPPFVALASGSCAGGKYDSRGNCIPVGSNAACAYGACPPYAAQNPTPGDPWPNSIDG